MIRTLINNARIFWQGALLSYKALFRWLRPMTYLASKVLAPLSQIVFFTLIGSFGGSLPARFFVIGNAMQIAAVSGIYGVTMSIAGDRWDGTLAYLFGSPAQRLVLFFGRAFFHLLDGLIGVGLAFVWGVLLFGLELPLEGLGWLFLTVMATVFSTSGLGLLMGCVGLITRNVMFINNTVYFLLLLFSGANVPLNELPGWMRLISGWLPLSHGISAGRLIIEGSGEGSNVIGLICMELGVGALYLFLGYLLFRRFEIRAKKMGSLETM